MKASRTLPEAREMKWIITIFFHPHIILASRTLPEAREMKAKALGIYL
jgi:hypothetical protein